MKFTIVFTTLLCVSTSWAVLAKKIEDPKDKREAPVGYGAPRQLSSHGYQSPATYSQGDASAISVGAGYSIGGAKPSYNFGGQGSSAGLQIPSDGLSSNGHATIQLAPITLQPGAFSGGDISQIMSQLQHSLSTGALSLQPSNTVAEFHQGAEGIQGGAQGQEYSFPQFTYGAPKYELSQQLTGAPKYELSQQLTGAPKYELSQQLTGAPKYELSQQSTGAPSYSAGNKGLSSYTSTGPVLFTPSESNSNAAAQPVAQPLTYGAGNSGNSLGDAGSYSLGNAGHSLESLGGSAHSFGSSGNAYGGAGQSLGGAGHSFGGLGGSSSFGSAGHTFPGSLAGLSLGGAGPSFGGSYKQLSGGYTVPSKTSFKPSAFLGASVQNEGGHGVSSLSGSYGSPSFGGFRGGSHGGLSFGSAGHGASFGGSQGFGSGSSKFIGPLYQSAKSEGLEGASALSSGHFSSPPGTTYGSPSFSYSNNAHAASSYKPYYVTSKQYRSAAPSSFGHGSSAYKAPVSGHSSLSGFSSGPKYSFSGSHSQYEPSDAHGSASETSYNTIKYSEELKPHNN